MAKIESTGLAQGDLVTFLTNTVAAVNECKTKMSTLCSKLDADASVVANDYGSTSRPTFTDLTLSV